MDNIHIPARERSPQVAFRFDQHHLALSGESYPEDAASFFGPLVKAVADYCRTLPEHEITFQVALTYFNTSSAKALMTFFQILDNHGKAGATIHVIWIHHPDDEMMLEFGQDFSRDMPNVRFTFTELAS